MNIVLFCYPVPGRIDQKGQPPGLLRKSASSFPPPRTSPPVDRFILLYHDTPLQLQPCHSIYFLLENDDTHSLDELSYTRYENSRCTTQHDLQPSAQRSNSHSLSERSLLSFLKDFMTREIAPHVLFCFSAFSWRLHTSNIPRLEGRKTVFSAVG